MEMSFNFDFQSHSPDTSAYTSITYTLVYMFNHKINWFAFLRKAEIFLGSSDHVLYFHVASFEAITES